ncbi:MAG TPA: gamma-glutamyltransferase [Terriglobia bacterium]|jgi:gamma-glutamyltranspeptidase/glutathione hydrolase|nr:gamma-glutamyltransferase [Terriglobia bacterium]
MLRSTSNLRFARCATAARLAIVALSTLSMMLHCAPGYAAVAGRHGMVASSEAHATDAGLEILRAGGNAVDAAVAVGFALAVTHPFAGNIGGGGFMLVRLASGEAAFIDYREAAPGRASHNMYLDAQGNLIKDASLVGALASGVPGTVAGLALAEQKYGKLGLARVMAPAIRLAADGFEVSYALAGDLRGESGKLGTFDESRRIFLRDGKYYEAGEVFRQPELARTLQEIAESGPDAFYRGPIAHEIAASMEKNHGLISLDDLAAYQAKVRAPLVGHFRGFTILSAPPPSSGGVGLLEMLNILEPLDLGPPDAYASMHLIVEAQRRAYADRAQFLGDSDFVPVPVAGLTSKDYAGRLRQEMLAAKPDAPVSAGQPAPGESSTTTHYSVVDADGDAVSNTYTLNAGYGSGLTVEGAGFLLNDEMDDFAAKPGAPNLFGLIQGEANAIAPRKRPLSSMTPTIVLEDSPPAPAGSAPTPGPQLRLVLGSPGGGTIINTVLEVLLNVVVFHKNIQQAVNTPRFHDQWMPDRLLLEPGISEDTADRLREAGYKVQRVGGLGDCEAIEVNPATGWRFGAADPRGDGKAAGY